MRPSLHFTPASGWINDPHGITYRNGGYHAFYQYVPGQTTWGLNCHWGHAAGPDLLSLREQPVAIAPGDGDDGIWTGAIVTDDAGIGRAFYTAVSDPDVSWGRIRVAVPGDENWTTWHKGDVVIQMPGDLDLFAFRDPFLRREGEGWRMFVGAALNDGIAAAVTYTSPDLAAWTYDGVALQRSTHDTEPVWLGALWECPQVIDVGNRNVMVTSVWDADVLHYAGYAIGSLESGRFDAAHWGRLTWGDSYYAPSYFEDALGRPCLTFWMRGIGGEDARGAWEGAHSVPYLLSVAGNRLVATPHPDVDAHRGAQVANSRVPGNATDCLWHAPEGTLRITSGGERVADLDHRGGELVVRTATSEQAVPTEGTVRLIVDGPTLEISCAAGLVGLAIEQGGDDLTFDARGGALEVYPLS